jgi:hypothetical protein
VRVAPAAEALAFILADEHSAAVADDEAAAGLLDHYAPAFGPLASLCAQLVDARRLPGRRPLPERRLWLDRLPLLSGLLALLHRRLALLNRLLPLLNRRLHLRGRLLAELPLLLASLLGRRLHLLLRQLLLRGLLGR